MLHFTDPEILFMRKILEQSVLDVEDESKKTQRSALLAKIELLDDGFDSSLSLTSERIQLITDTLDKLHNLNNQYVSMQDIGDLDGYDRLKKEFSGQLEFLGTLKDECVTLLDYLDNKIKKEFKGKLIQEFIDNDIKATAATNLVEKDARYVNRKTQLHSVYKYTVRLKTKYTFYMEVWSKVFQSVSTATKERFSNRNNNN